MTETGAAAQHRISADELTLLADFSQAFALTLDIQLTLDQAISRICAHVRAEAGAIFLVDPHSGACVCRAAAGGTAGEVVGLVVAPGQGIVGRTIETATLQLIADVQADPDFIGNRSGFKPRTMVCAPLKTASGVIGAIQLINKQDLRLFDQHDADLLRLLAVPTALALNNARLSQDLLEQNRIRREFQLARQIQKTLLPRRQRNHPLQAFNLPAREISGDFYDFFTLADGRIGFCVGDVSGKGMDAALLMVRASSLLRWAGKDGIATALWLERVNDELANTVVRGMFVCAIVGYYDPSTRMIDLASAGFPPAVHRGCDGAMREIRAHGPPLGVMSGMPYESERIALGSGSLWCFSDGVTDLRGHGDRTIGMEGAKQMLDRVHELRPRARLRGLLSQLRSMQLADDTTVLMVAEPDPQPLFLAGLTVCTEAENLRLLRRLVDTQTSLLGYPPAVRQQLVLAVDEACSNVIRHAYRSDPDGRMELLLMLDGDHLRFELLDHAARVDSGCIRPRDLSVCKPGGLGINLIDSVMDRWRFEDSPAPFGNQLTLWKRLP